MSVNADKKVLRVLIVAENASASFGGEAILPLHYFTFLRARGVDVFLLTHERVRSELQALFPNDRSRITYVHDSFLQRVLWHIGRFLPSRLNDFTFGALIHYDSQFRQRRIAKRLVASREISIVHEPTPVSPRLPSGLFGLGVPVICGPMNGGMSYPPAFRDREGSVERFAIPALRLFSRAANRLIPGKTRATMLLVANDRTERALRQCIKPKRVVHLPENGVDLNRFRFRRPWQSRASTKYVFCGRLIALKGVDMLLEAFASATARVAGIELHIFGDGEEKSNLETLSVSLGLVDSVFFHGFWPQERLAERLSDMDVLVLPSLHECGGAVVLEAMAIGLPVVATRWGGPADYLDESCGVLIAPEGRSELVFSLEEAICDLTAHPAKRIELATTARAKVEREYDWDAKIQSILSIYGECSSA